MELASYRDGEHLLPAARTGEQFIGAPQTELEKITNPFGHAVRAFGRRAAAIATTRMKSICWAKGPRKIERGSL
jgi:hypothetical protein